MIFFLNSGGDQLKDWWAHGGTAFALFGIIFCLAAVIPEYKKMVKYKRTTGINKKIFLFQLATAVLYFYGSSFFLGHSIITKQWASIPSGVLLAILNWIGSMGNLYIVLLKSKNVKESKELGISEAEHYKRVYAPILEAAEEEI